MSAPQYVTAGGVIFTQERRAISIEKAEAILAIHLSNRDLWLRQSHLSPIARTTMADIEQELADEMSACLREVRSQQSSMKEAA